MVAKKTVSKSDRKEASRHIAYEWIMLDQTFKALQKIGQAPRKIDPGVTIRDPLISISKEDALYNARLESFLIHARNLIIFLNKETDHPKNILAADFFEKTTDWVIAHKLEDEYQKINKYLAHLSYERKTEYHWDLVHIYQEIKKRITEFNAKVDPSFILPELKSLLEI
jgi:hypothetical protein